MRPKTLALLAVAAMCGLVAMLGVQQVLSKQGNGDDGNGSNARCKGGHPAGAAA